MAIDKHPSLDEPLVRVCGLTKTYREGDRERAVLRGVDFTIRQGELVVLLGRSGSGKSTLLNLISGIDLPTGGDVFFGKSQRTRLSDSKKHYSTRRSSRRQENSSTSFSLHPVFSKALRTSRSRNQVVGKIWALTRLR